MKRYRYLKYVLLALVIMGLFFIAAAYATTRYGSTYLGHNSTSNPVSHVVKKSRAQQAPVNSAKLITKGTYTSNSDKTTEYQSIIYSKKPFTFYQYINFTKPEEDNYYIDFYWGNASKIYTEYNATWYKLPWNTDPANKKRFAKSNYFLNLRRVPYDIEEDMDMSEAHNSYILKKTLTDKYDVEDILNRLESIERIIDSKKDAHDQFYGNWHFKKASVKEIINKKTYNLTSVKYIFKGFFTGSSKKWNVTQEYYLTKINRYSNFKVPAHIINARTMPEDTFNSMNQKKISTLRDFAN